MLQGELRNNFVHLFQPHSLYCYMFWFFSVLLISLYKEICLCLHVVSIYLIKRAARQQLGDEQLFLKSIVTANNLIEWLKFVVPLLWDEIIPRRFLYIPNNISSTVKNSMMKVLLLMAAALASLVRGIDGKSMNFKYLWWCFVSYSGIKLDRIE